MAPGRPDDDDLPDVVEHVNVEPDVDPPRADRLPARGLGGRGGPHGEGAGRAVAPAPLKLDLGAGGKRFDRTWTTVDLLPQFSPDVVLDLASAPWPWADGSVDLAFSNHVLEHLEETGCVHFLRELRRVLRVGGHARIGVPDCALAARRYVEGRIWETFAPQDKRSQLWDLALILRGQFSSPVPGGEAAHVHRTPFDEPTIRMVLKTAGWIEAPVFYHAVRGSKVDEFRDDYFWRFGRGTLFTEIRRT